MNALILLIVLVVAIHTSSFRGPYVRHRSSVFRLQQKVFKVADQLTDPLRLDVYLSHAFKEHSRSFFGALCDEKTVLVNDKVVLKSHRVSNGDRIVFDVEDVPLSQVQPEEIPLDILYEDEHMIAINKPNGMVVHPAVGSPNGTFVNALLFHIGAPATATLIHSINSANSSSKPVDDDEDLPEAPIASPRSLRPGIVHRLDKGTTGVLLAGKHPSAVDQLSQLFAQRRITKTYLAICVGFPGELTMTEAIGRGVKNRQIMCVYEGEGSAGKPAVSHCRTVCFDGKLSVVLVRIETGRTHQIRVHLKHRRTPLLGDDTYGSSAWNRRYAHTHAVCRPLLHAYEAAFEHPFSGKQMVLQAPLPADMLDLVSSIASENMLSTTPMSILDPVSRLLTTSTEVMGTLSSEVGGTPIIARKGHVPVERLVLDEDDWFSQVLPDDPEDFMLLEHNKQTHVQ